MFRFFLSILPVFPASEVEPAYCVLSWAKLFSYKICSCSSPQIINSVCELTEWEQDFQQLDNKLEGSEGKGTATEAVWNATKSVNLLHRSLLV